MLPLLTLSILLSAAALLTLLLRKPADATPALREESRLARAELREALADFKGEMSASLKAFGDGQRQSSQDLATLQREKFADLERRQEALVKSTEERLDRMRETVDEKLHKTLTERLGQSFQQVQDYLKNVQEGVGEMKTLAQDVGGLKRVLSNVKMRGGLGEVQLAMLLENILAPDQYARNVKTKRGSADLVEFALKLPGQGEGDHVWLPIDAKAPLDAYEHLQTAYDGGEPAAVEAATKNLLATIKRMATDICTKYVDPPHTTDFSILFLPFEGMYAEVVRRAGLLEEVQRDCKVIITGPTTLAAILNSLQMGFRTLAIQRRSSEVWEVLSAVKGEFEKFGGLLEKAQKNLHTASSTIDEVMGVRTRAIQRKLKGVEVLNGTGSGGVEGLLDAAQAEE